MAVPLLGLDPMTRRAWADVRGFSITELMLTVAIAATLMAIAVPALNAMSDATKLSVAAQAVERELQTARMRAVSKNSTLRLKTNCPSAGYYRMIELLGTSADNGMTRCDISSANYPWPARDNDLSTLPNYDGPLRQMLNGATVANAWIEFRPDGSAWQVDWLTGNVSAIITPVSVTITGKSSTKTITVNELGKILLQ